MKKMYLVFARRNLLFGGRIWDCSTLIYSEDIESGLRALHERHDDANSDLGWANLSVIPEAVLLKMIGKAKVDSANAHG